MLRVLLQAHTIAVCPAVWWSIKHHTIYKCTYRWTVSRDYKSYDRIYIFCVDTSLSGNSTGQRFYYSDLALP